MENMSEMLVKIYNDINDFNSKNNMRMDTLELINKYHKTRQNNAHFDDGDFVHIVDHNDNNIFLTITDIENDKLCGDGCVVNNARLQKDYYEILDDDSYREVYYKTIRSIVSAHDVLSENGKMFRLKTLRKPVNLKTWKEFPDFFVMEETSPYNEADYPQKYIIDKRLFGDIGLPYTTHVIPEIFKGLERRSYVNITLKNKNRYIGFVNIVAEDRVFITGVKLDSTDNDVVTQCDNEELNAELISHIEKGFYDPQKDNNMFEIQSVHKTEPVLTCLILSEFKDYVLIRKINPLKLNICSHYDIVKTTDIKQYTKLSSESRYTYNDIFQGNFEENYNFKVIVKDEDGDLSYFYNKDIYETQIHDDQTILHLRYLGKSVIITQDDIHSIYLIKIPKIFKGFKQGDVVFVEKNNNIYHGTISNIDDIYIMLFGTMFDNDGEIISQEIDFTFYKEDNSRISKTTSVPDKLISFGSKKYPHELGIIESQSEDIYLIKLVQNIFLKKKHTNRDLIVVKKADINFLHDISHFGKHTISDLVNSFFITEYDFNFIIVVNVPESHLCYFSNKDIIEIEQVNNQVMFSIHTPGYDNLKVLQNDIGSVYLSGKSSSDKC